MYVSFATQVTWKRGEGNCFVISVLNQSYGFLFYIGKIVMGLLFLCFNLEMCQILLYVKI